MVSPFNINPKDVYIYKNETKGYCFASNGLEILRFCLTAGVTYQLSHYESEDGDQISIELFRKEEKAYV